MWLLSSLMILATTWKPPISHNQHSSIIILLPLMHCFPTKLWGWVLWGGSSSTQDTTTTAGPWSILKFIRNFKKLVLTLMYIPKICIKYRKHGSSSFSDTFNCVCVILFLISNYFFIQKLPLFIALYHVTFQGGP